MITQGKFKDGTDSWKYVKLQQNLECQIGEGFEIIWSEDGERICDHVYKESDAKLIAAAPKMLDALIRAMSIVDLWTFDSDLNEEHIGKMEALNMLARYFEETIKLATN